MNRFLSGVLALSCAVLAVVGVKNIIRSGILEKYPEPEYLSADERSVRPVYEQLSKTEQSVYTALYRGVNDYDREINLPCEISGKTYSKIYCLLEKQESELFFIDSTYYTAEKIRTAKVIYREDKKDIREMRRELEVAADDGIEDAGLAVNEYDTVMRIHDYIVKKCRYIEENESGYCATAYGCLVENEANCEGYAKAFDLLASRMGLESVLVTGTTDDGENHAWNQVKVDGNWYNIDVTWDDTDVDGDLRRVYFLCDDEFFGETHFPDSEYLQTYDCGDSEGNFYIKNGLYADSEQAAEEILRREIRCGKTQAEIRFADDELYDLFMNEYIEGQEVFQLLIENGWGYGEKITVSVRENKKERCITVLWEQDVQP